MEDVYFPFMEIYFDYPYMNVYTISVGIGVCYVL